MRVKYRLLCEVHELGHNLKYFIQEARQEQMDPTVHNFTKIFTLFKESSYRQQHLSKILF
jgi:hypothetical protein